MHGTIGQYLSAFAHDDKVTIVAILIAVDVVLGVTAAFKLGTFRLAYLGDFMKNDVLGKVFPWFVLYAADKASHSANVLGPIDFGQIAGVAFGVVVATLAGSILSSLNDLGIGMPVSLGAGEKTPVVYDPVDRRV